MSPISIAFGITPEFVRALEAPVTLVPELAQIPLRSVAQGALVQMTACDGVERLVPKEHLLELCLEHGIERDDEMLELYLVGIASDLNRLRGGFQSPMSRGRALALGHRAQEIVERRPELMHPLLLVPNWHRDGATTLFRFLAYNDVRLDPARMVSMRLAGGVGAEMLQVALDDRRHIGFEALLIPLESSKVGTLATAHALLAADGTARSLDLETVKAIAHRCAAAACSSEAHYLEAIDFLNCAVKVRRESGSSLYLTTSDETASAIDTRSATRQEHPIPVMLYELVLRSAQKFPERVATVDGFPERPAREMAELLNQLLAPVDHLPLESLTGMQLLEFVTIGAVASAPNTLIEMYLARPTQPEGHRHNPDDIFAWAATRDCPAPVTLTELEAREAELVDLLQPARYAELHARVAELEMGRVIAGRQALGAATPESQPPARRRARVV